MKKFDTEVRLSREMSLMGATLLGVGAMIGAGIFVLIGIAAGVAGPALIIAFILNGLVALLTAMSYAELGSCYHDAGGGYITAIGAVNPGNMTPWAFLAAKKEIALVDVASSFFVGGGILLLVGGLISTMSALNATVYSSSRVAYAMVFTSNIKTFSII